MSKDVIARRNRSWIAGLLRKSCNRLRIDSAEVYFNAVIATQHARAIVPSQSERSPIERITVNVTLSAVQMTSASRWSLLLKTDVGCCKIMAATSTVNASISGKRFVMWFSQSCRQATTPRLAALGTCRRTDTIQNVIEPLTLPVSVFLTICWKKSVNFNKASVRLVSTLMPRSFSNSETMRSAKTAWRQIIFFRTGKMCFIPDDPNKCWRHSCKRPGLHSAKSCARARVALHASRRTSKKMPIQYFVVL